jgi:thiamine kinase-like enzyme
MISPARSADIIPALARIPQFAGRALDDVRIEPLASLTNRNYKVSIGDEAYALRIAGEGTERYIDRAAEARNAGLAASIGIAPDLLYFDSPSGLMLTRFIDGGLPLQAADMRRPELLRSAVGLLKRLHDSRLAFAGRMDLFPKLDEYMALAAQRGWPGGLDLTPIRRRAEPARAALERTAVPLVPSHIDPVPQNFVRGPAPAHQPTLYLLDWEYAAMAEPMWDLAAVSIEAELDAEQERILLDTYFAGAAARQAGRFALYKASLNLLAAAWAVVQLVDGNPSADFAAFARQRLAWHVAATESAAYRAYVAAPP